MQHAGGESVTSSRADAGPLEKIAADKCEALAGSPALFERQFVGLDPLPRAGCSADPAVPHRLIDGPVSVTEFRCGDRC